MSVREFELQPFTGVMRSGTRRVSPGSEASTICRKATWNSRACSFANCNSASDPPRAVAAGNDPSGKENTPKTEAPFSGPRGLHKKKGEATRGRPREANVAEKKHFPGAPHPQSHPVPRLPPT